MTILLLALAGGAGSLLRFIADGLIRSKLGRSFPWGTLIINVSGALALGIITGLTLHHHATTDTKLVLGTGLIGGYTTFSTASFETVRLVEDKRFLAATLYGSGNIIITIIAGAIGIGLVS